MSQSDKESLFLVIAQPGDEVGSFAVHIGKKSNIGRVFFNMKNGVLKIYQIV